MNIDAIKARVKAARNIAAYWASPWRTLPTTEHIKDWRKAVVSDIEKVAGAATRGHHPRAAGGAGGSSVHPLL
jgi:hypothetical protein